MATQYGYSRSLAAVLFVALLVLLYGGCAKSTSTSHVAVTSANSDAGGSCSAGIVSEGEDGAMRVYDEPAMGESEAGTFLGYRDPDYTGEAWTPTVSEEEIASGRYGDTDEGYSGMVMPASNGYEEEGAPTMHEEPTTYLQETGMSVGDDKPLYEETPSTEPGDTDEYAPGQTDEMDSDRSDTVTPWLEGENSEAVMSDSPDTATTDDPNLVPDETPIYETSPSGDMNETNNDDTPGPPP